MINAGALRTKSLAQIKAGFICLDKGHNAALSKATSSKVRDRWANYQSECKRKLLTYVKRCHARIDHPSSNISSKLYVLIDAQLKKHKRSASPGSSPMKKNKRSASPGSSPMNKKARGDEHVQLIV